MNRRIHRSAVAAVIMVCSSAAVASAADRALSFNRAIRPILSDNCFKCHGPDAQQREAGLRLDERASATGELESGRRAIVPGEPESSELVRRIFHEDPQERMPPPRAHKTLTDEEKALLKRWISEGAKYQRHWSFSPPTRPDAPAVSDPSWPRNPIDRFVLARLDEEGLAPSPEADRRTLIRRLSLDLNGLPPTPKQVRRFLADDSPDAYRKLVDRLLASPRFGERMAIPWLDAARYADTNGFSIDDHREMWVWREWVIRSYNSNKPFDEFATEQLAGDLLPDATRKQKIATGFLRNGMNTHEGGTIPEEYRVIYLADKVDTVSSTFLGLTMQCGQCHDHKYDPITQADYYRFFAFFDRAVEKGHGAINGNTKPTMSTTPILTSPAELKAQTQQRIETLSHHKLHPPDLIEARAAWAKKQRAALRQGAELPEELAAALRTAPADRSDKQWRTINQAYGKTDPRMGQFVDSIKTEINVLKKQAKSGRASTMIMQEAEKPRQTYVLKRGQYNNPDKDRPVEPGVPKALPAMGDDMPRNRLGLARWLTRRDNPLTARVAVNRYWQMLFNRGIVPTANDFGAQGKPPTHPALLDWLAVEFMESGWDIKHMVRLMVTSATYRQTSAVTPELRQKDPNNKLLARAARFRLPAELVRDNALAISGRLVGDVGGMSVYPPQPSGLWQEVSHFGHPMAFTAQAFYPGRGESTVRRSLYTFWKRTSPPPTMATFDAPSREVCTLTRSTTNTPLQALVLMNGPQFVESARALAGRMMREGESTPEAHLRRGFALSLARPPHEDEQRILLERYRQQLQRFRRDPSAARQLLGDWYDDAGSGLDTAKHAAWTTVATAILNLDETITRE